MYPGQMSGGECQRACIAASLLAGARILILDEPTTMLDTIARRKVVSVIRRLQEVGELGTVVISHDVALVCELSKNW
jgi:ABC-type glutathione transport system ATPase component